MTRQPWWRPWMVVTVIAATPTCAQRTDRRVRRAWITAEKTPSQSQTRRIGIPIRGTSKQDALEPRGWRQIIQTLDESAHLIGTWPDPAMIAQLAQDWCAVPPEPQSSAHGDTWVCFPEPPITAAGHRFTLELSALGVIGLVAADLSDEDSVHLARLAQTHAEPLCTGPWSPAADPPLSTADMYRCPATAGTVLTVGRLPQSEGDRWQISIVVLAAS